MKMLNLDKIKIVKPGVFVPGADPSLKKLVEVKKDGTKELGSTVTLIRAEKNVLVDCGMYGEKDAIISGLNKEGLSPNDIDILVLTHAHSDHFFNCALFENAVVYWGGGIKETGKSHPEWLSFKDKLTLCKDVYLIDTPGILQFHSSVLVRTDKGNVVIAGDAITLEKDIDLKNKKLNAWNPKEYDKSRKKILKMADYIILGHGHSLVKIPK